VKTPDQSRIPKPGQFWKHPDIEKVYQRIDTDKNFKSIHHFKPDMMYFYSIDIENGEFCHTSASAAEGGITILEPINNTINFMEI
jgi:hypothetical protein